MLIHHSTPHLLEGENSFLRPITVACTVYEAVLAARRRKPRLARDFRRRWSDTLVQQLGLV